MVLYSILSFLFLLQGIKEETWEAFIADVLFLAKVITINPFAKIS